MVYVIMGLGAAIFVPVASLVLFLWGLGGLMKGSEIIKPDDEDEET